MYILRKNYMNSQRHIYIFIYRYVYTHIHTNIYIYIYMRFVLKSYTLFPPNLKDSESQHGKSCLIYKFLYKCGVCYIGRTTQWLEIRIKQYISPSIRWNGLNCLTDSRNWNSFSVIRRHLLDSPACANENNPKMFCKLETSNNVWDLADPPYTCRLCLNGA